MSYINHDSYDLDCDDSSDPGYDSVRMEQFAQKLSELAEAGNEAIAEDRFYRLPNLFERFLAKRKTENPANERIYLVGGEGDHMVDFGFLASPSRAVRKAVVDWARHGDWPSRHRIPVAYSMVRYLRGGRPDFSRTIEGMRPMMVQ